jgi:hypothetical protein
MCGAYDFIRPEQPAAPGGLGIAQTMWCALPDGGLFDLLRLFHSAKRRAALAFASEADWTMSKIISSFGSNNQVSG